MPVSTGLEAENGGRDGQRIARGALRALSEPGGCREEKDEGSDPVRHRHSVGGSERKAESMPVSVVDQKTGPSERGGPIRASRERRAERNGPTRASREERAENDDPRTTS